MASLTCEMRQLAFLCLLACPSYAPRAPEQSELAPIPPELVEPKVADLCRGYCATITRCWPEFAYAQCEADCLHLLAKPEASSSSGFTLALVECWSAAASCQLAAACDAEAEGKRK